MCLVSIIIPTYKPGNYLLKCLLSLKEQSCKKNIFEIIIVLNGPLDNYFNYIEEYIREELNDISVHLLYIKEKGVSSARNAGINRSKGKYICFIDDDDFVSNTYIENLLELVGDYDIVVSNVKTYDRDIIGEDYLSICFKKYRLQKKNNIFKIRSMFSSSCCKIIPRKVIANFRFNSCYTIGEDALFMATISKNIKSVKFALPETIYYRRLRKESASRQKRPFIAKFKNSFKLSIEYILLLLKNPLDYNYLLVLSRIMAVYLVLFKIKTK